MKIGDLDAHEHTCKSCKAVMKHYHKGGCNMPAEIECESCKEGRVPHDLTPIKANRFCPELQTGFHGSEDNAVRVLEGDKN